MNTKPFEFDKGTPEELQRIITDLHANSRRPRIRVFYGDPATGRDWGEENETTGYIGKSTGTRPIPLLVHNTRSLGGPALLTACIVKLVDIGTGRTLYQNPKYHHDTYRAQDFSGEAGYVASVMCFTPDGSKPLGIYANCKSYKSASAWRHS